MRSPARDCRKGDRLFHETIHFHELSIFMSYQGLDNARISLEYERRAREIPEDYYSLAHPANLLMHQQTIRSCIATLRRAGLFPLGGRRVADIGCGVGSWLVEFVKWGADPGNLAGIDLMPERVQKAMRRVPGADLHVGSASELPWANESFDLVSQVMVFTNIFDPDLKRAMAREMLRVVKRGGGILWFDMRVNNPQNREIKAVKKAELRSLFPGCSVELTSAVLAPPLSRLVAGSAWALGEVLHALPFLRTHYAGLIRKV
jgi:ubiquinone/menaquinone biosynthesis C-methylase UbiE